MKKSVAVLSGGLDSTVNLYQAARETQVLLAITFNYGQRAASNEIEHSHRSCHLLKIPHKIVELPFFKTFTHTSLVNKNQNIPKNVLIDDSEETISTAQRVWVPNRNGIFLNIAAGFAEGLGADYVIPGFNIEEASTFPDNTQEFLNACTNSFSLSTQNKVQAICYTTHLSKTKIVELGKELGVNFNNIWSCYLGDEMPCGTCESCLRLKRALQ